MDLKDRGKIKFTQISALNQKLVGKELTIIARIHNIRAKGKTCFMELREKYDTIQATLFADNTSTGMVKFAG